MKRVFDLFVSATLLLSLVTYNAIHFYESTS